MVNVEYLEKIAAVIFKLPSAMSFKTPLIRNRFPHKKPMEITPKSLENFHNKFGLSLDQKLNGETLTDKIKFKKHKWNKLLQQFIERGY